MPFLIAHIIAHIITHVIAHAIAHAIAHTIAHVIAHAIAHVIAPIVNLAIALAMPLPTPLPILLRMPLATAAVALQSFGNMEFDLAVPLLNACRNVDDGKIDFDPSSHTPSHKFYKVFKM